MADNLALRRFMDDLGLTQAELARRVNVEIGGLTGKPGTVSERTVYNWLTGKTSWPPAKHQQALRAVFGCTGPDLGFIRPGRGHRVHPEDDVNRRSFMAAAAGATLAIGSPAGASPRRVGHSDVERLNARFAGVIASDHRHGGKLSIETRAAALADEALDLQKQGIASQRVRAALFGCAASFMSSAMWAAIDGRRFDAAERHHERAASLAAMSGDGAIQFRIWSHAGSLYRHMRRPGDALAANDVARSLPIARRDPLFASLGHARHAAIHGLTGDVNAVRRSVGRAQDALDRAGAGLDRPVWLTAHYDQAELDSLALAAHLALGRYEDAEAHAHRSLALLRSHMQRSRAITHARLARAQLGQGGLEPAVTTAMGIPGVLAAHPRVAGMLDRFGSALVNVAPNSPHAQLWNQYTQDNRRAPA
ncbi:helix-turn-helix transcriptional regulator [Kitasatospora sp. NPDC048296]|uniref:helix-turn-helix transcriptional regulator n=1 Tax=Kitasatospora sp. NPDC048296 TaxID=3364048 RepID=UPI0037154132